MPRPLSVRRLHVFTFHVPLRSTNATSPKEVPTSARRLSITSFELLRYNTLVSRPRTAPVRFTKLLTTKLLLTICYQEDLTKLLLTKTLR